MLLLMLGLPTGNPDYWLKDLEGNQLPYVDAVKLCTITEIYFNSVTADGEA